MIRKIKSTSLDKKYLSARQIKTVPIKADLSKVIVNKPWGYEFLMFDNRNIEVWNLFINCHKSTSMHCHPYKKTALILIEGKAVFSSLNESFELAPLDVVMIDKATFHSTLAISKDGVKILEIETPPMKHDLVRLEDKYGRTFRPYEGPRDMSPDGDGSHLRLIGTNAEAINIGNKKLSLNLLKSLNDLKNYNDETILALLNGKILRGGRKIYGVGDTLNIKDIAGKNSLVFKDILSLIISGK